ncbi:SDR family NAD(P)-dependent oxidoreductase [Sporosarcina highlanderae]|uniref:SDR family NAD(P)-dependent oxidoreductase n=1 Tax=Sporosarcina highlanderae TaxID=3035916 RepID=A0ABT8JRP1_9BACL|nr:SDR family NAD(P)-dependent oxidoreductase [Sporosarcina highlanderae]MDN4607744.1 SDR family NAD(P)-dependent oxidoreductase [Sporosarcina highlanderae]
MTKRKVLITGATSGVGFAVAMRLLADTDNYTVIGTGRAPDKLWELHNEGAEAFPADVTNMDEIERVLDNTGEPDIVIFSAGVGLFESAHLMPNESIRSMMETNVIAPIELTKRILPHMMDRQKGHLIYIGSQAGKVATPKASVYAATKHALIGYTNALRMEVAEFGIDVSVIHPGPIDTPFIDGADRTGKYRASLGKHLLQVDTVADAVLKTIDNPVREVNLPKIMGLTSKLYLIAPKLVEKLGRKYFTKK